MELIGTKRLSKFSNGAQGQRMIKGGTGELWYIESNSLYYKKTKYIIEMSTVLNRQKQERTFASGICRAGRGGGSQRGIGEVRVAILFPFCIKLHHT